MLGFFIGNRVNIYEIVKDKTIQWLQQLQATVPSTLYQYLALIEYLS